MNEHIETVVIGAGQAGLSTAYHLERRGHDCVVLDAHRRVGDNWRHQWDTLRLFTPARYDGLPGLPFPADPWAFPGKDEVADYLESYARRWDLPVRTGVRVRRLGRADGHYVLDTSDGTLTADNVVVATGTFGRTPQIPRFAADLDPSILQLHSSEYRRPDQLAPGPVLVVGASHSGGDIAYELAATHPVVLCGPDRGQLPLRIESRAAHTVVPVLVFLARHLLTRRTPVGRQVMDEVRFHGGPLIRVRREDLAARGVDRREARMSGARDGRPVLEDGTVLDVANVVWCTGFRQRFEWIDLPVLGEDGWPKELRGVVEGCPGLFFCGLSFQSGFGSMVFFGVGRDAEYVARRVIERSGSRRGALAHAG